MSRTFLLRSALLVLMAVSIGACSDDTMESIGECGDGICSSAEDPQSCPRDCSYSCLPGTGRCIGNTFAVCQDDGLHEIIVTCQEGQYCTLEGCLDVPDAEFDVGLDAADDLADMAGDRAEESVDTHEEPADVPDDLVDAADDLADAPDDLADTADDLADTADDLADTADDLADTAD